MESLKVVLKEKGLRATPGRLALLTTLEKTMTPISAEELHARTGSIDIVTVYRTLQSLVQAGLAREVRFKDASVRYEYAHMTHHHHLVCTRCNSIEELPECDLSDLESTVLRNAKRFASVEEHALEFFGICTTCVQK